VGEELLSNLGWNLKAQGECQHELNLPISFPKLVGGASLFFKNAECRRGRFTVKEPGGKWICRNIISGLVAVLPEGGLEDVLQVQK
jgi:hypothetical protein